MGYLNSGNELYHYGVPGMKWGVRRTSGQIKTERTNKQINNLGKGSVISKNSSSIANDAKNIVSTIGKGKAYNKAQKELSKMSDDELKKRVNRMNLEQQYSNMSVNKTSKGRSYVENTLAVAGSALAITGSALSIALSIKQLKR